MIGSLKYTLAASIAALVSVPAQATNFVLSPIATGGGDYAFDIDVPARAKGKATDNFAFTIPGATDGAIGVALINIGSGNNNIDFVSAILTGTGSPVSLGVSNVGAVSTVFNLADIPVVAGTKYILSVTYTAGAKGALASGNIAFAAAAAPEPATWALMILGFGLVGAALRARGGRPAYNTAVSYS